MNFYEQYAKSTLAKDIKVITDLIPPGGQFLHREKELAQCRACFGPITQGARALHFFGHGGKGTGKTAIICHALKELDEYCKNKSMKFTYSYVNCKATQNICSSSVMLDIIKDLNHKYKLGKEYDINKISGYPSGHFFKLFERALASGIVDSMVIVLDEIDVLLKSQSKDHLLYYFSRLNEIKVPGHDHTLGELVKVSIVIISNDVMAPDCIDDRTWSSLGRNKVDFSCYDAKQLCDILKQRTKIAFRRGVIQKGVLEKIAHYEANCGGKGDARTALAILYQAYKIAMTDEMKKIPLKIIDKAILEVEEKEYANRAVNLPRHMKILLMSLLAQRSEGCFPMPKLFDGYKHICSKLDIDALSDQRLRVFVNELEMHGYLDSHIRYFKPFKARTKLVESKIKPEHTDVVVAKIYEGDPTLSFNIKDFPLSKGQKTLGELR